MIRKILTCILVIIIAAVAAVGFTWHNEISSILSIRELREANYDHNDGAVYYIDVKGGFYLDDFVAQGGCSNDDELIAFVTGKITKGIIPMDVSVKNIACTSFTAETENGERLFGRNYDMAPTAVAVVRTNPGNGRHASISTVDLRFVGIKYEKGVQSLMNKVTCLAAPYAPMDGINDAGVACGIYMSNQTNGADQKTDKPDMTSSTLTRMILDYASNVEEAVEIAKKYDLHDSANSAYHYMVADASGKSAILEWVAGTNATDDDGSRRELVVTYNDDDAQIGEIEGKCDYQWVTNFIIQPDYYAEGDKKVGLDRYEKVYEMLSANNGIVKDKEAGMDILKAVARRTWDSGDHKEHYTIHSVVYDLTNCSAYWVSNENYDDETAVYTFDVK